jgi:hypothetical protein
MPLRLHVGSPSTLPLDREDASVAAAYMRTPTTIVRTMNGVSAETSPSAGQALGTARFRRLYACGPYS